MISEPLAINVALFGLVPNLLPNLPQSLKPASVSRFIADRAISLRAFLASSKANSTNEMDDIILPNKIGDEVGHI
jgi:hypothetical protein